MNKTDIAVNVFNKLAKLYQDKFMDVSFYAKSLDLFCDSLPKKNSEILELACGPGNVTKHILNHSPELIVTGIDLAPNMVELARINNPNALFEIMDCREIGMLAKKYNGILAGFCFPYLSKEEALNLIRDAGKILKKNGIIYISTMEDDYTKSGIKKGSTGDEIFMHYHQADYLETSLKENRFKIIHLERLNSFATDGTKTVDLIMIAKKN